MKQVVPEIESFARIVVVGVGGAGGAAVNRMIESGLDGVEFIAVNTDAQALEHSAASTKINIGLETTRGLGAGANPSVGQAAAEESTTEIRDALQEADMVFITFGAGGGTGSGAGPVVARIAQDMDKLVIGIVTKPFAYEGPRRMKNALGAIDELEPHVDTLITIPNDRILQTIDRRTPLMEAFKVADDVLRQGVHGISDLITKHGLINLDFADVKTIMKGAGSALMGIGRSSSDDRAVEAAQQAVDSPLLDISIDGAKGVLFNVSGGEDMSLHEIHEAATSITSQVSPDANIIFGATVDPSLGEEIVITLVAAGFDDGYGGTIDKVDSPSPTTEGGHSQPEGELDSEQVDTDPSDEDPSLGHEPDVGHDSNIDEDRPEDPYSQEDEEEDDQDSDFDKPAFLRRLRKED